MLLPVATWKEEKVRIVTFQIVENIQNDSIKTWIISITSILKLSCEVVLVCNLFIMCTYNLG